MEQVIKNPEIDKLDKDSNKYKMYIRLYQSFFNAQTQKSPSYPLGIEEGDQTSIRLHNTSYNMADIIGDSIEYGTEGIEIDVSDLLKKSGDSMVGELLALNGFGAGMSGKEIVKTYQDKNGDIGLDLYGVIRIDGDFVLNGRDIISRDASKSTTTISDDNVIIDTNSLTLPENTQIGSIKFTNGDIVSGDKKYYHTQNANLKTIDWNAKDMTVEGLLAVNSKSNLSDTLVNGKFSVLGAIEYDLNGSVKISKDLNIFDGLSMNGKKVLSSTSEYVSIGNAGGDLLLGTSGTKTIKLIKPLKTWNGSRNIITENGVGSFFDFESGQNGSDHVIKTYTKDSKRGVLFSSLIWLGSNADVSLQSLDKSLFVNIDKTSLSLSGVASDSLYKPQNRESKSILIDTKEDFIVLSKPTESISFTIKGKKTRLLENILKLSDISSIEATKDDMVIHGLTRFDNNISSQTYSSGYAGHGWGIQTNKISGVTSMSLDELTVRKKMRIYELEVNKTQATGGSLWVSDSIKADVVETIIY